MKLKLTLIAILICNFVLIAQDNYQLKGTISDETGEPIPGVNVIIENTERGTSTDFDGNFEIKVARGETLDISYIGFVPQSIVITNQKKLNIVLIEDTAKLDEIVVVGYGTRKKSHLTGSVSKVGGDDVAAVQTARVDDALAGKLAGVLIQNQSGEPGADPKIQIRAASSITGNSNPLIVVDGYPISGSLATVNPNDIESIEILKDAASAAIYGSRGANGVILVTSKKGKAGKTKFSFNSYTSTSNKYIDNVNMTASEFADHAEAQIANGNWDVSELESIAPGFVNFKINAYRNSPDVVAKEDYIFKTGNSRSYNFSMSGGKEDSNFFASIGYLKTKGVVITQNFERINARLSADTKLGKKFKTGISFNGYTSDRTSLEHSLRDILRAYSIGPIYHTAKSIAYVQQLEAANKALGIRVDRKGKVSSTKPFDNGRTGIDVNSIYNLKPGDPVWDWHYGREGNGIGGSSNPGTAALIDNKTNTEKTYFANISSYLEYSIIEGLNLKTVLGGDYRDVKGYQHALRGGDNKGELKDTYLDQQNVQSTSVLSETTLSYKTTINDKHEISALIGVEFQKNYLKGTNVEGNNVGQLLGEPLNYSLLAPQDVIVTERDETIHRESIFGRITYAYDNRYLFSASLRRDGDSRFGSNNKHQVFPAFSIGWNVHNESFFKEDSFLSKLKPRVSFGSLGTTSNLGAYNSLSFLNPGASVLGNAFLIPKDVANPNLTWQTNTETNYGIDLGFLDNRFTLGVDYYTSKIDDILIDQSVSEVLGRSSIRLNAGDVKSSGLELELNARLIRNDDFSWSMGANLSTVQTKITDLDRLTQLPDQIYGTAGRGAVYRNYVGGEIGELWALQTSGWVEEKYMINPVDAIGNTSGEVYVVDQQSPGEEGYGVIDATKTVADGGDLVKVGTNTPDFYWGMTHNLTYKNFDMSIQIQGSHGGKVYNVDPLYFGSVWGGRLRSSFDANNDKIADHNGLHYTRARDQTDAVIQDAGFVALRNLTIGYTFDDDIANKIGLSSIRLYTAATNLLYLVANNYTSYNPEGVNTTNPNYGGPTTYGHQEGASPVLRTFTFGINVNF